MMYLQVGVLIDPKHDAVGPLDRDAAREHLLGGSLDQLPRTLPAFLLLLELH